MRKWIARRDERELQAAEDALAGLKVFSAAAASSSKASKIAGASESAWASYSPQRLMFFGWGDLDDLTLANLRIPELVAGPTGWLDLATSQLPLYTPLRRECGLRGSYEGQGEEWKPTALMALLGAASHAKKEAAAEGKTKFSFADLLSSIDVVSARKQFKALMCLPVGGSLLLYAYRPAEGAPIVLERGRTYEEQPNTLGAQFEKKVMHAQDDNLRSRTHAAAGSLGGAPVADTRSLFCLLCPLCAALCTAWCAATCAVAVCC